MELHCFYISGTLLTVESRLKTEYTAEAHAILKKKKIQNCSKRDTEQAINVYF